MLRIGITSALLASASALDSRRLYKQMMAAPHTVDFWAKNTQDPLVGLPEWEEEPEPAPVAGRPPPPPPHGESAELCRCRSCRCRCRCRRRRR